LATLAELVQLAGVTFLVGLPKIREVALHLDGSGFTGHDSQVVVDTARLWSSAVVLRLPQQLSFPSTVEFLLRGQHPRMLCSGFPFPQLGIVYEII
jgi:hypothetical protein